MQYVKTSEGFILRLLRGEELFTELLAFAKKENITAGILHGIGAMSDIEVGYYDLATKEYSFKKLTEPLEVVSMTGNVAVVDNEPFFHIHAVFSDPELKCYGGHVKRGTVHVTLEIYLQPYSTRVVRELDENVGLKLCTFPDA
ncbi:MAG: DNA-binding protein [bacterium]|nr:DNA-binding protein [bacterium]